MNRAELRNLATELLPVAIAVGEGRVPESQFRDLFQSFQSFGGDKGAEQFWFELYVLYAAVRRVQNHEHGWILALKSQIQTVENLLSKLL